MTTTAFKNLRAIIQLISVLLILINIPIPAVLLYNTRFTTIEIDNLNLGYLSLSFLYKVLLIFNITLGMFASCGTNSKVKFYMRLYLFFTFLFMLGLITYILYVRNFYQNHLLTTYTTKTALSVQQKVIMSSLLFCSTGIDCDKILKERSELFIKIYLSIGSLSFILHFISFVLIKIAVNISIEKPHEGPKFVTITRAGMNTESLRNKRVMNIEEPAVVQSCII
ncbi:hypothetical protein AAJ76_3800021344 [Vairimorpha ceranae]|uniref:Uncharacterized protein n=1 Tax=Vairimorpha ceranae TaxID=40302 RepID=A0A0F9YQY2_9MICR|nr:hypothetical protein AAJ76_3800021344 [Vairimorpha ceranae]KAF5140268.1 hypothetical protein G9O61_00g015240 [Vairimorpha ceranae]KKO74942.1 hypothetical protein AAJ76_3800021344 [Vairimorpha ceranae]